MLFSVAAFLVAWLSGLAAGVPADAILKRSLIGAAAFFLLGFILCSISEAFLGFPGSGVKQSGAPEQSDHNDGGSEIEGKD